MIVHSPTVLCRGFAICTGHVTANETYEYSLEDTTVDTKFSQIFYLYEGSGALYDENDVIYNKSSVPSVWDLRMYYKKKYKFVANKLGATWICINPIPAYNFFDIEHLHSNTTKTIIGDGKEHVILSLRNKIIVNDAELTHLKYSRILNGKVANVIVPSGSEALYLTR